MSTSTGTAEAAAKVTGVENFNAEAHMAKAQNSTKEGRDWEYANAQAKEFIAALKNGILPFQPKENGYCDIRPAYNVMNHNRKNYKGINQMMLKIDQKTKGYKTAEYLTVNAAEKAYNALGVEKPVLKSGAVPVMVGFIDKENSEKGFCHTPIYNIECFTNPGAIRQYAEQERKAYEEEAKKKFAERGETFYPSKPRSYGNGTIYCKSTDPVAYIGQWEAAVSLGKDFKVSSEQSAKFAKNCGDYLWQRYGQDGIGKPNTAVSLGKLMNEAGKHCVKYMKTLYPKQSKELPEQGQKSPERTAAMAAEAAVGW